MNTLLVHVCIGHRGENAAADFISWHHDRAGAQGVRVLGDLRRYRRVLAWRLFDSSVDCEVSRNAAAIGNGALAISTLVL
jgi:hypothetical protein